MKIQINPASVKLWLSANETEAWASRPGRRWPCSKLSENRVFAEFDSNGLCDFAMNGKSADVDATELSACCADHLVFRLQKTHPCYDVAVGQFLNT